MTIEVKDSYDEEDYISQRRESRRRKRSKLFRRCVFGDTLCIFKKGRQVYCTSEEPMKEGWQKGQDVTDLFLLRWRVWRVRQEGLTGRRFVSAGAKAGKYTPGKG